MIVDISCEMYARMIEIALAQHANEQRTYLKSMFIERKNNQLFAVVTNVGIAAIEFLGPNIGPDEYFGLVADENLMKQCEQETPFNSYIHIDANLVLNFGTAKTTFGYVFNGNAVVAIPETNNFVEWRNWLPDEMPKKSFGAMYWSSGNIWLLATASKSGALRFPAFIDVTVPVLVCDVESDAWIGLFIPTQRDQKKIVPATIPDWVGE